MQYTYEDLAGALRKAHAAGNVQHATALTKAIQELQANENNVPTQPVQGDTSLGTAFKHGDLMAQANTMDYIAEANVEAQKGWFGAISDPGRKYIGNPIREALGFEPLAVDQEGINVQEENLKNTKINTDKMRDKAKALNYQSLTSDHLSLNPVTWAQYGAQKVAESGPQMLASIASGGAMSMPLLAGEVNQNMKEIEGLDQNTRIKLATVGGTIAAAIENLGLGLLVKGIPKDVLGKMGAKGVVELASKVYGAKVAGKIATAMATEGITEGAQEYTFLRTEAYGGAEQDASTYADRLKEATIGGAFAGGTIRTVAETPGVLKAAKEVMPEVDSLKMIHGGDKDALSDVANDAEALFNEYPDRKISNLDDSKETLDDLHSQYQIQWSKIKEGINSKVKKSEEFRIAEKRAKNKVKNEASKDDIAYLESINPELGKLARKMNVITRFNRAGIRGGVGQYTQALNPLVILRGLSGRSAGGQSQYSQGLNRSLLGVVVGAGTQGASLAAPIGAAVIDAATGLRNRLQNSIKKYGNRPGITAPSQPTETDPNNPEGFTGKQLAEIEKTIKTKAEYKHIKVLMDEIEQLRKKQQETEAKIQGQQGNIDDFIDYDNIQAKIDELQKQIKKVADDKGITGATPTGEVIKNEYAYQSAINLAETQRDIAIEGAPETEIKSLITRIADARSREEKRAIYDQGLIDFPEHKQYFADNIQQLTEFGPETRKETSVQEKVLRTGDPDVVQEKSNLQEKVEKTFGPNKMESLHKNVWDMPLRESQITALINEALNEGFDVKLNASDNAFYRRQQAITLKSDATKTQVLHEIFHAVENKLSPQEMSTILNNPIAKEIATEVNELYPELDGAAKTMEILAETAARLQKVRGNTGKLAYILSRIKDLIEAFKNLLDGNGFRSVNSVLDEIYTGKAHQRAVNENYDLLYVPDVQLAKSDKPGGPMVAKRVKVLRQMEEKSLDAESKSKDINTKYDEAMDNVAKNLNIEGITPDVLKRTLSGITPSTELGHVAVNFLKAVGVMDENGVIPGAESNEAANDIAMEYEEKFIALLKALQKGKIIGDFGLAFRTSAGGKLYPVHMLEPITPELLDKANLNNIRKLKNRVTTAPLNSAEVNSHPLGVYSNTEEFIKREQKQPLVINDQIYKMISRMATTPQIHRGLDLVFKKDGTTDSAYTLAAGEAIKQYEDHQTEEGGMSPVYMKRKAQDRLRIDALNGSASYQGKAGKAIWEFANWEDLGPNGFEQFAHSLRDHFGISNELPYNERVAWLFGSVGQYMKLSGRPKSEFLTQEELDMPFIDWLINGTGMNGGHVYAHNRGGVPKLFLDKGDVGGKKIILYQKNHAIFDVAEHGFEMQRAAIELGRMRAFLEKNMKGANKIPSSELFMMQEALEILSQFKSSYPTWFDATSSAYQLHAVLTGDTGLALVTNILNMDRDGPAGDLYRPGAEYLERTLNLPQVKTRKITKKFISNRRSYGQVKLTARKAGQDQISKELPEYADQGPETPQDIKDSLSNIQRDLETQFDTEFPGAAIAEGVARSIAKHLFDTQGREFFAVRVPLPDGDVAVYDGKVPDSAKRRVTWQLDAKTDKRVGVPVYKDRIAVTGFAAFLNHALDAYVQRELAKRLRANGVSGFMHTHDAFAVHPKNAALMRELYHQIVLEVANTPIYEEILKANGLNANDMTVKYNITSQEGGSTEEVGMLEILQNIRNNKAATFGKNQSTNYYALS
mgnify:CR=1 FL=1|tara:strand:+ start:6946 stop:12129 length:5184 start_codon:yes stop_codon:yes gene_type:complete